MSIAYENARKAILLRSGQLADAATAAAFETVFNAVLATAVGGMEVPLTGLKYAILASEKRIAALCGRSKNPILRRPLYGRSANIAHLGQIPTTDNNSKQWVGNFSSVLDATTNEPLTEKPKQTVLRDVRMYSSGTLKIRPMHFCEEDTRMLHTRANIYLEGCVWDYATQLAAYDLAASPLATLTFDEADVSVANNTITEAAHPYYTGLAMTLARVGAALPSGTGFTDGATVYAIWDSSSTIKVATSLANALLGVPIDFTDDGTGNGHTLTPQALSAGASPLDQSLETMLIADVLANIPSENWFASEGAYYSRIVEKCEADIKNGLLPQAVLPDPVAGANPVAG